MRPSWICDLGTMPYGEAFELQYAVHGRQVEGALNDGLLFVEHPPVITTGRRAQRADLFTPLERLRAEGIEVAETDRGGQMTYHGPGQIVAYPLVNVTATGLSLHGFVRGLEQAVIDTLETFGIAAGRVREHTGVWVGNEKICAIGLRIRRWWSIHGLALNVDPNLDHFGLFVPCGITDRGVTSMSRLLGRSVALDEVKPILAERLGDILKCEWTDRMTVGGLRRRIAADEAVDAAASATGLSGRREALAGAILAAWPELPCAAVAELDSTRDEARRRIGAGVAPPFLIACDRATDPRGRDGESWVLPAGTGLLFTLVVPFPIPAAEPAVDPPLSPASSPAMSLGWLELIAALAVAEGLEPFSPTKPRVKWPNDILVNGRKVGMVFGELVARTEGAAGAAGELEGTSGTQGTRGTQGALAGAETEAPPGTPGAIRETLPNSPSGDSPPEPGLKSNLPCSSSPPGGCALLLTVLVNVRQAADQLPPAVEGLEPASLSLERLRAATERVEVHSPDHDRLRRLDRGETAPSGSRAPAAPTAANEPVADATADFSAVPRPAVRESAPLDPISILAAALRSLRERLAGSARELRPRLIVRCSTIGRGVRWIESEGAGAMEGLAVGVDPDGALVVQIGNDKTERIHIGRVRELPHV